MENIKVGDLIITLTVGNQLGEGVQWNDKSQTTWWADIESSCLYCYSIITGKLDEILMPDRVGCFSFTENEDQFLCR